MHKIHAKADITILVPVRVKAAFFMKTDGNVSTELKRWSKGLHSGVENAHVYNIIEINGITPHSHNPGVILELFDEAFGEIIDDHRANDNAISKISNIEVVDSR